MALTEREKSAIRRHLKYGNIGLSVNAAGGGSLGANASLRYFSEWGELESRMNSLSPIDEATLTGNYCGLIVFQGLDPDSGNQIVLHFSGDDLSSEQNITVVAAGETRDQFALKVAAACAQNSVLNAARIIALAPDGRKRSGIQNPITEVQLVAKTAFNISITSQTGKLGGSVVENGTVQTDVYQTINDVNIYGFLPICNALYGLIGTASDRMGVDKADVFTARKSEYKERRYAWKQAVDDMADFLVSKVNPNALNGVSSNLGSL